MRNTSLKQKIYKVHVLPLVLKNDLNKIAKNRIERNKFHYLVSKLSTARQRKHYSLDLGYRPLSQKYLVKMFGTDYSTVMNKLLSHDVLQRDNYFENKCYSYRINRKYLTREDDSKIYYSKYKYSYWRRYDTKQSYFADIEYRDQFLEYLSKLEIPYEKLFETIDSKLNNLSIRGFKTNEKIPFRKTEELLILEFGEIRKLRMNKEQALEYAQQNEKLCIQDESRIYIVNEIDFLEYKKRNIKLAWETVVLNLKDEDCIFARRNKTNKRLDTNFTNMPKELLKVIYDHNGLEEIDLKNSQPALLANIISLELKDKEESTKRFIKLCKEGQFYDFMSKQYGYPREDVKIMIFEVFFGKWNSKTDNKKIFEEHFPQVAEYIKHSKRTKGNNEFCVNLQKRESDLFIDQIYPKLTNSLPIVFTKHDSLAYPKGCRKKVINEIENAFRNYNIEGSLDLRGRLIRIAA